MSPLPAVALLIACVCAGCGRFGYVQHQEAAIDSADTPETQRETPDKDAGLVRVDPPEQRPEPDSDAGYAQDASVEPPNPDAGEGMADAGNSKADAGDITPDAGKTPDAAVAACAGARVYRKCWYLGEPGASCIDTCAARGGVDPKGARNAGIPAQGGSPEECQAIMDALGEAQPVTVGFREDGLGLGCHRWDDGVIWWLDNPAFDVAAAGYPAQLACACTE